MTLTPEWQRRIDQWRQELWEACYAPLGQVAVSGFTTLEQLDAEAAQAREFHPMPPGTRWGAKWEYGWFRADLTLPEAAVGQRIVLRLDVGDESIVWVNGQASGAKDFGHREITLAASGVPGARYTILAECYAGHGPRVERGGPIPLHRESVPEPPPAQATVGVSSFGVWREEVYQAAIDFAALYQTRGVLDPNSLRVAEIDQGLMDATTIIDFELPEDEFLASVRAGRERLAPLLACVNGSTAPTVYMVGHAHLDVAWLWPLQETERKIGRTLSTQLALMEQYPEYRYLQSQPHLFQMLRRRYPELYARLDQAVARGQVIPEGATWVEPDTNIPSGESLIRQFIHGKRFFREAFGIDSRVFWEPDVFGYSGALPQIMRGCGVDYFITQKIVWAYNGGDPFPYNTFLWEGIDGTAVLAHIFNDYSSLADPASLALRWSTRLQKQGIWSIMLPFGYGDGGGGPTRDHLEFLRRERDLEGIPRAVQAGPLEFFREIEARGLPANRYVGELYFQAHRGTYTSQARTKLGNRRSELLLREAELWGAAARVLRGFEFGPQTLDEAWKQVLLNQFHDILPGSSIARVYEEAEAGYAAVQETARGVARAACAALASGTGGLTVFNSLGWRRAALVALPAGAGGATDARGEALPAQELGGRTYVAADLPSCGWTTLRLTQERSAAGNGALVAGERLLENEHLRVELNDRGEIARLFDKDAGRELAAGACNSFRMYKDVPSKYDAWDIDSMYTLTPVALDEPAEIEVVARGPLVAALRVRRRLHNSDLVQEIRLRAGSRRIDFVTEIDWQERHKLLKVAFPVNIHTNAAIHEIQFGHIRRPNHHSRPFDADRFEVSNHRWSALAEEGRGVAVLNDCKYGISALGNTLSLTLLRAPLAPDMRADLGLHRFTYALYAWNGSFADCDVVAEGYDLNVPPTTQPGAAGDQSLLAVDAPNIVIETVKPAEDGSDDIVVRLYEAKRTAARCTLATSIPARAAEQTDMLEGNGQALDCADGRIALDFRPFEVKTVRLRL